MSAERQDDPVTQAVTQALANFDLNDPIFPPALESHVLSAGDYPYAKRLKGKTYEKQLLALQEELVKLQSHVRATGTRMVLVFEGRDAAGKGGSVFRFLRYMNPRAAKVVALPKPSETELGQWYFQRYADHLPTSGEIVLFDRSWYNRGCVEPVMGFCTPEQTETFLDEAPRFEHMLTRDGIMLFKFWLNIGQITQLKRFHDRRHDPLKVWKLSPVDLKGMDKWDAYTHARDRMLAATHTRQTPWTIVRMNDKRRGHIEIIRHVLRSVDYLGRDMKAIGKPDHKIVGLSPQDIASL